jgi:UDP-glucose-4-epimerase GalE
MRVLVAGGAGYIGSHTCKALHAAGITPVVYDDLSTGHRDFVRWGPLVVGDIADTALARSTLREHSCVAVVHFAAHAYVGESVADPRKYYRNNVVGTLHLLDAALEENVRAFVFSSTCATYGVPASLPITEDSPQLPINPYGETKLAVERALAAYDRAYGMRSVALRYFNAAGADPDGELGERHDPETHLIPLAIDAALGRRGALAIFGDDYPTPDGTAVRDYIHVSDLAEAHVRALRYALDGKPSTAVNLGTGRGYSVREVVDCVGKIAGVRVPANLAARRAGDPPVLVAGASRAKGVLAWEPRCSALETIVSTAHRWHAAGRA